MSFFENIKFPECKFHGSNISISLCTCFIIVDPPLCTELLGSKSIYLLLSSVINSYLANPGANPPTLEIPVETKWLLTLKMTPIEKR